MALAGSDPPGPWASAALQLLPRQSFSARCTVTLGARKESAIARYLEIWRPETERTKAGRG
jgi:hypothetical protein